MRRVIRVVSAIGAGASLVWGLAKSLRRKKKSGDVAWPPEPTPAPEPVATEPETEPVATEPEPVAAAPEPVPPAPEPEPAVETPESALEAESLVLKGVAIDDPAALLAFVNETSEDDFVAAGVKGKALTILLANRPFASAESVGSTSGIGRRTLQALTSAAEG